MDQGKTMLIILIIVIAFFSIFLGFRNYVLTNQMQSATTLNAEVITLFKNVEVRCKATDQEPEKLTKCLQDLNKKYAGAVVEESGFQNVDKNGNPGFIVVKNSAIKPLNSSDFTLLKNLKTESNGCEINGTLAKGYTCKLTFFTPCEKGAVLEVLYQGSRAWLKNC